MEVIDMMKAQLDKSKARAQEIEGQLNKANKGMKNTSFIIFYHSLISLLF